jgi:diacylglycerol kinase family enzyme
MFDPAASLTFVVNAAAGHNDVDAKRSVIEAALRESGRAGELVFAEPGALRDAAQRAAAGALATRSAIVAVGGDGTINTVAQAAHAAGCAMGVLPQGTFNYFARTHGISNEPVEAMRALLVATPQPVQVGAVNDTVFLVNASLGLYPDLLEDREAYKARFGRSRLVALLSVGATLLRERRQLQLRIERHGQARDVRTPTLFIGNNRLQLEQVGVPEAPALDAGRMAAVMLQPIGSLALLWLLLRGALGSLGDADDVESFEFDRMLVATRKRGSQRRMKVAFDGEVAWMHTPLAFSVSPKPLFLLKSQPGPIVESSAQ